MSNSDPKQAATDPLAKVFNWFSLNKTDDCFDNWEIWGNVPDSMGWKILGMVAVFSTS